MNKQFWLRILIGVYLLPLCLVCFSLSVPPGDLPLCGLMFVTAGFGFSLARRETRAWRLVWLTALTLSILGGALEIVAGQRIAHQRSHHQLSIGSMMGDKSMMANHHRPIPLAAWQGLGATFDAPSWLPFAVACPGGWDFQPYQS